MGKNMAVGLGPLPDQFWEVDLPDGVHRDGPIEPVAWADLLGTIHYEVVTSPRGRVLRTFTGNGDDGR
jgi:alanine racemase